MLLILSAWFRFVDGRSKTPRGGAAPCASPDSTRWAAGRSSGRWSPPQSFFPEAARLQGLTDSKQLTERQRNVFDAEIRACAQAFAVAAVDVETIDRINIRHASLLAMRMAVEQLAAAPDYLLPDYLLIDGCDTIDWPCSQQAVVKGDARSISIAAASVLAKVFRDRLMVELDAAYPGYGLARHKGYCSPEHLAALNRLGPTPLHRKSYAPVAQRMLFE